MPPVFEHRFAVVWAGLLVAGATLVAGAGAWAATELRFSHYGPVDDPVHAAAERLKELVEAGTGGEVTVSIHPDNRLGEPRSVLQAVRVGEVDLAVAGNPDFAVFEPALAVFDLPFLFDSAEHAYAVLDGEVGRAVLDRLERHNMKGLGFWEVGFRDLTNSVRPVHTPTDLKGLMIGTTTDPAYRGAFQGLGATPVPVDGGAGLLDALRSGAVDGREGPMAEIRGAAGLDGAQPYLSLTRHGYTAAPLVMNLQRFNGLTPEQRRVLVEAAQEAAEVQRRLNAERDARAVEAMKAAGVEVVETPDVGAFRRMVGDRVRATHVAERDGDGAVLERIDALKTTRAAAAPTPAER